MTNSSSGGSGSSSNAGIRGMAGTPQHQSPLPKQKPSSMIAHSAQEELLSMIASAQIAQQLQQELNVQQKLNESSQKQGTIKSLVSWAQSQLNNSGAAD